MFIVFNKRKIYSYLVSLSTVVVLFAIAFTVTTDQSIITSSNVNEQTMSITIEDNWNEINIDNILKMLNNTNTKAIFSMSQEWANNYPTVTSKITQAGHEIEINKKM